MVLVPCRKVKGGFSRALSYTRNFAKGLRHQRYDIHFLFINKLGERFEVIPYSNQSRNSNSIYSTIRSIYVNGENIGLSSDMWIKTDKGKETFLKFHEQGFGS